MDEWKIQIPVKRQFQSVLIETLKGLNIMDGGTWLSTTINHSTQSQEYTIRDSMRGP